ncbi:MAG TPA: PLP-dependent transferase, partial [Saprospiraceae bacterium]|nr:PLP-dependent transferase [Saprospiraceae bacterium]
VSNFLSNIKIIRHAPTLGDLDTLVLHPYSSSHRNIPTDIKTKLGIRPGLIRLSTGIEALDDIIQDLNRGLNN